MDGFNDLYRDAEDGYASDTVVTFSFRNLSGLSFDIRVSGPSELHVTCRGETTHETTIDISTLDNPKEAKNEIRAWGVSIAT